MNLLRLIAQNFSLSLYKGIKLNLSKHFIEEVHFNQFTAELSHVEFLFPTLTIIFSQEAKGDFEKNARLPPDSSDDEDEVMKQPEPKKSKKNNSLTVDVDSLKVRLRLEGQRYYNVHFVYFVRCEKKIHYED